MKKVAIVYWSGTGNTRKMAEAIAEGVKSSGAISKLFFATEVPAELLFLYDTVAFGCPSMGAEVLEESEFQPMWDSLNEKLVGKHIALFGSYGWGDGEWMRLWEKECEGLGAEIACNSLIINGEPDDEGIAECMGFGRSLA